MEASAETARPVSRKVITAGKMCLRQPIPASWTIESQISQIPQINGNDFDCVVF
jgi:hypothetical protein